MICFSHDECNQIINTSNTLEKVRRDEIGRPISYDFYSIGCNESTKWIFDRLNLYFTKTTGIGVIKNLEAVHLFNYSVGDRFVKHRDIYYENQAYNIGVCLNDDYIGGDFILYHPKHEILKKQTGKIYTFKNSVEHEVLEITSGNRWSLIGFYFYENLDLKKSFL